MQFSYGDGRLAVGKSGKCEYLCSTFLLAARGGGGTFARFSTRMMAKSGHFH